MSTAIDIGQLIHCDPNYRDGRPCIAGTGITVHRIVQWYKMGKRPEDIADDYPHLSRAQVYAALAYHHANYDQIESQLLADEIEEQRLYEEHKKAKDQSR